MFLLDNSSFDCVPGSLGDRWLVNCLGILHSCRGLFYRVVPADQSFNGPEYCGLFRFRFVVTIRDADGAVCFGAFPSFEQSQRVYHVTIVGDNY